MNDGGVPAARALLALDTGPLVAPAPGPERAGFRAVAARDTIPGDLWQWLDAQGAFEPLTDLPDEPPSDDVVEQGLRAMSDHVDALEAQLEDEGEELPGARGPEGTPSAAFEARRVRVADPLDAFDQLFALPDLDRPSEAAAFGGIAGRGGGASRGEREEKISKRRVVDIFRAIERFFRELRDGVLGFRVSLLEDEPLSLTLVCAMDSDTTLAISATDGAAAQHWRQAEQELERWVREKRARYRQVTDVLCVAVELIAIVVSAFTGNWLRAITKLWTTLVALYRLIRRAPRG